MAIWQSLEDAAQGYGIEVGDLLRWIRTGDIIYSKLPGKMMVDIENLGAFLDDHKVVGIEAIVRKKLRKDEEKLVYKSTGCFYDNNYYKQLQIKGSALSPIVVKALATLINNREKREIFTSVMHGETLRSVGARLHFPVNMVLRIFNSTVEWLNSEAERTYASQLEAYQRLDQANENLRIELDWQKENYKALLEKYVQLQDEAEALKTPKTRIFSFWKKKQ